MGLVAVDPRPAAGRGRRDRRPLRHLARARLPGSPAPRSAPLAVGGLFTAYPSLSWDPWPDAYIFVGTLVAMYAQARGMVEFWFAWLLVDLVGVPLDFANGYAFSGFVYVIYGALVLWGMRDWWLRSRTERRSPPWKERRHDRPAPILVRHRRASRTSRSTPSSRPSRDIAAGRPVVVVDDEDRENEGDLVIAAEKATPEIVAFMMSECRGLICAPMEGDELDRLELPQMVEHNTESMQTAFTVSVDAAAAHGVTTGISAADRATTLQLLAERHGRARRLRPPRPHLPAARQARRRPGPQRPHRGRRRPRPARRTAPRPARSSRSPARTA